MFSLIDSLFKSCPYENDNTTDALLLCPNRTSPLEELRPNPSVIRV